MEAIVQHGRVIPDHPAIFAEVPPAVVASTNLTTQTRGPARFHTTAAAACVFSFGMAFTELGFKHGVSVENNPAIADANRTATGMSSLTKTLQPSASKLYKLQLCMQAANQVTHLHLQSAPSIG